MGETSTKPYLIRALHEWCTDNGYTPYITVQVDEHTMVPMAHVRDGQITLNVGTLATNRLVLGNEFIEFQARFSGVTENVTFPWAPSAPSMRARPAPAWASKCSPTSRRPLARGTAEPAEEGTADAASPSGDDTGGDEPKRPRLTIVSKSGRVPVARPRHPARAVCPRAPFRGCVFITMQSPRVPHGAPCRCSSVGRAAHL